MSTRAERRELYGTARWQRLRLQILRRDGCLCQCPECRGRTVEATVVHHIRPWTTAQGEERELLKWSPDNLQSVARDCHKRLHAKSKPPELLAWDALVEQLLTSEEAENQKC